MMPYGRQHVTEEDIESVIAVLKSDWLTQGPAIESFESELCNVTGATHAVAVNSATSALHIACLALDLRPGEWLWTSPITFLASAYAGLYCGANVSFVDIEPQTGNISVAALAHKLGEAERLGRLPKVVVAVHFAGRPCDMESIRTLAQRYRFAVIADAAHAIGGSYRGVVVGSSQHADITVFSFHPVKVITSGEGGAAVTDNAQLAARMRRLRSHGTTRDPAEMASPPDGPWSYQAIELGWNYRMTDIQAALGLSQLRRLHYYIEKRRELAERYTHNLIGTGIALPIEEQEVVSAWHLYVIGWNQVQSGLTRREAFDHLRRSGVGVQVHYPPVHLQPIFAAQGFHKGQFPNAEKFYEQCITLPLHPQLSNEEQDKIIEALPLSTYQRSHIKS